MEYLGNNKFFLSQHFQRKGGGELDIAGYGSITDHIYEIQQYKAILQTPVLFFCNSGDPFNTTIQDSDGLSAFENKYFTNRQFAG
jgi:hypothetical protein